MNLTHKMRNFLFKFQMLRQLASIGEKSLLPMVWH